MDGELQDNCWQAWALQVASMVEKRGGDDLQNKWSTKTMDSGNDGPSKSINVGRSSSNISGSIKKYQ